MEKPARVAFFLFRSWTAATGYAGARRPSWVGWEAPQHAMKKSGAQIFLECLVREGVDSLFGYPGGVVLAIYDKLKQYPQLKH